MSKTILELANGKELRVMQTYEEVRKLLQEADAADVWLELRDPSNGSVVGINPANVIYIRNTVNEGPGPGSEGWESAGTLSRETTPA